MMVIVTMIVVVIVVIMIIGGQEFRLDIENAVEVEGVAAEHFVERDLRALGAVQLGVRIDGANARLDLGQFARRH